MNFNVAELVVPEPEHYVVYGHHYSVAPIVGMLALHCAKEYAIKMIQLTAEDIGQSAWASSVLPDSELTITINTIFDPNNNSLVNEYSKRIARAVKAPKYSLVFGLFDNQTADPHHPKNMVGFAEVSLNTQYDKAKDWVIRAHNPQEVYPSIGPGVVLRQDVAIGESSYELSDIVFDYALAAFNKDDVGISYRNTLDLETCQENEFAIDALSAYGKIDVSDFPIPLTSLIGEHPVRLQIKDLKELKK